MCFTRPKSGTLPFVHAFGWSASSQSNTKINAIQLPGGKTPTRLVTNYKETRLPVARLPRPSLLVDIQNPSRGEQNTGPPQPIKHEEPQEQQSPPQIFLDPHDFTTLQIADRRTSISTVSGLTPTYSSKHDSDSSSYTSGSETTSQRSRRYSSSMASDSELKEKLRGKRVECPRGSQLFIVPRCAQESLITQSAVERAIRSGNPHITDAELKEITQQVCNDAKQMFATLVFIKKGREICHLLREGVTDEDLPLQRKFDDATNDSLWLLQGRRGNEIRTLEGWSPRSREKFSDAQRLMTSPVFEYGEHYELDNSVILPYITFKHEEGKELEFRGGGYSEVSIKCIHPSHHRFWKCPSSTENRLVAIKRLISPDENEFHKEETILRRLGPKNHPNLIQLLATYRQEKKWHLIFPYADANLYTYWEHIVPLPNFDETTVLWSLKQMYGIADGLRLIHIFTVTIPLSVDGPGEVRVQGDARLSVEKGEEWYGRHGDIKPENILWFKDDPECSDENGVLKIADFGLGRFHGRDSRSKVNPKTVLSSPTYEPPELKIGTPVSRAYDFWSLGCVYLEFISWLLGGWEAVKEFSDRRAIEVAPDYSDDNFFLIVTSSEDPEAEVRDGVIAWVKELYQHARCSGLIHDLLKLIMDKMLVVDSKERINATDLHNSLKDFVTRAEEDKTYMLEPKPLPKESEDSDKYRSIFPLHDKPKKTNPKKLNVRFADQDTTAISPKRSPTPSPTRSPTWPT